MTDTGKCCTCLFGGVIAAVIIGLATGQLLMSILFGIYAVVIAIVCMTVESIARKTWTAFLIGVALTTIYYFGATHPLAWIIFLCETGVFTIIACLKETESS